MRNAIIAIMLLALTACSQSAAQLQNPVSPTNLYEAELVFDGSLKTFNELKALCVQRVLPAKCRTYVVQGQSLIVRAYAADKSARQFVQNNPTIDATNVIQAFIGIVSTFNVTVAGLGETKGK